MFRKSIVFIFICSGAFSLQAVEKYKFSIATEFNLLGAGLGTNYLFTDKLQSQVILGVSSNFTEPKWNDLFIQLKTQYQVLKGKTVALPLGLSLGGRIIKNYNDTYGVFYAGAFTGLDFQLNQRNRISLNIGYKYGQKHYEVTHSSQFGKSSFIEVYRENPFLLSLSYARGMF